MHTKQLRTTTKNTKLKRIMPFEPIDTTKNIQMPTVRY